jgi:hypothetical protein
MTKEYKYNTYKQAMEAVKIDGNNLKNVNPDLQTPEMAMIAVKWYDSNFVYVRPDLQTHEMVEIVATKYNVWLLEYIQPNLITLEIAMKFVKSWGNNLKYVPAHLITPEMAMIAVEDRGWNLEHVPAHLQTKEVIEIALKKDPMAKEFIKVKEMFKNALGEALGD